MICSLGSLPCRVSTFIVEPILPRLNGEEVTRLIVSECPDTSVIAISTQADRELVTRSTRAGASAYVLADGGIAELLHAFWAVSEGRTYIGPDAEKAMFASLGRLSTDASDSILTTREREVLRLMAEGKPTKEIANVLNVSVKTVETHRRQIMKRLGIYDVAGLTKFAIRNGITSINDGHSRRDPPKEFRKQRIRVSPIGLTSDCCITCYLVFVGRRW